MAARAHSLNKIALTQEGITRFVKELKNEERKKKNMKKFNFLRKLTKKEHRMKKMLNSKRSKQPGILQSIIMEGKNQPTSAPKNLKFPSINKLHASTRFINHTSKSKLLQSNKAVPDSPLRKRKKLLNRATSKLGFLARSKPPSKKSSQNFESYNNNNFQTSILVDRNQALMDGQESPSKHSIGNFSLNPENIDEVNSMSPFKIGKNRKLVKKKSGFALSIFKEKKNKPPSLRFNEKNVFSGGLSKLVEITDQAKKEVSFSSPDSINRAKLKLKSLYLIQKMGKKGTSQSVDFSNLMKRMKERKKLSMKKYYEQKNQENEGYRKRIKLKAERNMNMRCSLGNLGDYGFDYSFWRHFKDYEIKEVKRNKRKSIDYEQMGLIKGYDKKYRNKHFARTFNKSCDKDVKLDFNETQKLRNSRVEKLRMSRLRESSVPLEKLRLSQSKEPSVPVEYDMTNEFDNLFNRGFDVKTLKKMAKNDFERRYHKAHNRIGSRIENALEYCTRKPFFVKKRREYDDITFNGDSIIR